MDTFLYPIVIGGFLIITIISWYAALQLASAGMALAGFSEDRRIRIIRILAGALVFWDLVISVLAFGGFFSDFSQSPPRMVIVFVVPFIAMLALTFSRTAKEILPFIPVQNIIRLQGFRVVIEILLWLLLIQNLLPVQMTLEGRNYDILTGLTAPLLAWVISRKAQSPAVIILWNIMGLLLLFNVMIIAMLSMPTPMRVFLNEPANTIVSTFPFIWLPALLVPLAYGLHFISIRQALISRR